MPRGYLLARLFLILGGLSACGGPAIYFNNLDVAYSRGEVLLATDGKALRVEVFGKLTPERPLEEGALARAVARALGRSGPHWFRVRYTTSDDDESSDRRYKIRWLFNVPTIFHTRGACADDMAGMASDWREATGLFVAAFCRNERSLTWARGSIAGVESIESAKFYQILGATGRVLLPPRNPLLWGDCPIGRCD